VAWLKDNSERADKDEFSDRCFVSGLSGHISEIDFARGGYKNKVHSYGGAVWRLAANSTSQQLAAASDDGRVNIYSTSGGSLAWETGLSGLSDRALSAAWHPTEPIVFAGSASGTVCGWDLRPGSSMFGRVAMRFTLPSPGKESCLVWSLAVLRDFTVATGDSYGQVTLWDGQSGTPHCTLTHHRADVFALALWEAPPGDAAAGAVDAVLVAGSNDGKVSVISRQGIAAEEGSAAPTAVGGSMGGPGALSHHVSTWTVTEEHREHSHDIRGLGIALAPRAVSADLHMASAHRRNKRALKRAKEAARQAGATAASVEEALAAEMAVVAGRVPLVISAGDDGNIVLSCVGAFNRGTVALPPLLSASQVAVASNVAGNGDVSAPMGLAVVRQRNHLEVWGLGALADVAAARASVVTDLEAPSTAKHALRTRMLFAVASAGSSHVAAVSVSPCGRLLAYVADEDLHVLQVALDEAKLAEQVPVHRVRVAWNVPYGHGIAAVQCLPGGTSLAVATTDGCVTVLSSSTGAAAAATSQSAADSNDESSASGSNSDSGSDSSSSSAGSAASGAASGSSDEEGSDAASAADSHDSEAEGDASGAAQVFPMAPGVTMRKISAFRVPCSAATSNAVALQAPETGGDADSESEDREELPPAEKGGKRGTKRRSAANAAAAEASSAKKPRRTVSGGGRSVCTSFALGGCLVACDTAGKWLAITDTAHVVHILSLAAAPSTGPSAYHKALPRLVAHPAALAFAPPAGKQAAAPELGIVGIDGALATVHAGTGMLTAWSREHMASLPAYYVNRFARGAELVMLTWYGPTKLLISTRSFIVAVDTTLPPSSAKGGTNKKSTALAQGSGSRAHSAAAAEQMLGKNGHGSRGANPNFRINSSYSSVMSVAVLGGNTGAAPHLLVAQADTGKLAAALPAAIAQTKFGST